MRFLADESCDFTVVRALREAAHVVVEIVGELGDRLIGAFAVIEPGRARLSRSIPGHQ